MKQKFIFLITFVFLFLNLFSDGVEPGGLGTELNPYLIETLDNLLWISTNPESWDKYFEQTADIDAGDTSYWNDGAGFSPIGNQTTHFTGEYNGQNHYIAFLYINRPDTDYVGMFGYCDGALIEQLGLYTCDIFGDEYVGIFAGGAFNFTNITTVSASGHVTGTFENGLIVGSAYYTTIFDANGQGVVTGDSKSGGILGYGNNVNLFQCSTNVDVDGGGSLGGLGGQFTNNSIANLCSSWGNIFGLSDAGGAFGLLLGNSQMINCYSFCDVLAAYYAGGLVGTFLFGCYINNCYSIGYVDCDLYSGPSVGQGFSDDMENSFYNSETCGQSDNGYGTGKTTAEMEDVSTYTWLQSIGLDFPWDFVGDPMDDDGNEDDWNIVNDINGNYPFLTWENFPPPPPTGEPCDGEGTEENPYLVATLENLRWISENQDLWDKHFKQTEWIDASETSSWNDGAGFSPIGNSLRPFTGEYDGNICRIDNLFINRPTTDYVGLFGCTWNAYIGYLILFNSNITGRDQTGSIAGENHHNSLIEICKVVGTSSLNGRDNTGGLVGKNHSSAVKGPGIFIGSVSGQKNTSGLVGNNFSGNISEYRVEGPVEGSENVGALAGNNGANSSIVNSSAQVNVTGDVNVSGGVGRNRGDISDCYTSGFANGDNYVGGWAGTNEAGAYISKSRARVYGGSEYVPRPFVGGGFGAVLDCFYADEELEGRDATGKTEAELKDVATYTDLTTVGLDEPWDFVGNPNDDTGDEDIWDIDGVFNDGYPFLVWEVDPPPAGPTNVAINIVGDDVIISWDDMGATLYKIYSSDDPYTTDWGDAIGTSGVNSYIDIGAAVEARNFYFITISEPD